VGIATWYGASFQGLTMANGSTYNMYNPTTTAANVYPLGTWLRVTRLTTGESIFVQVTDRGAFRYPDIVDLSYAAFSELANPSEGVIAVRVEPMS
jgi:rare lipoprotein A